MADVASMPQGIEDGNSRLALTVQHETKGIKSRGMMSRKEWANPLAAAPSAVGTMAILLKTASSTVAAGIPVKMREVRDAKGNTIGTLQSTLLCSNLQACSDLGRSAFAEARITMDYINKISQGMIQDKGKMENILGMLNDPDEACGLEEELKDITDDTNECLEKLGKVTEDFHCWYWVICCLKGNVLEGQGQTQEKANQTDEEQKLAKIAEEQHSGNTKALSKAIEDLEAQLEAAKSRVVEAEALTEKLANLPPVHEPSLEEEMARVEKDIPMEERKKGLLGRIGKKLRAAHI